MVRPIERSPLGCRQFLFLIASAREDGAAERLARRAAQALPDGTDCDWLWLASLPLDPFEDIRHKGDGVYPAPHGHARTLLDATLAATDIVLVVPVYWYALPASAKLYLDHWSGWMRLPGVDFKPRMAGKRLWAVTIVSDETPASAEPLLGTLRLTADYMAMEWGGSLLGYANRPEDILSDVAALDRAGRFFSDRPLPATEQIARVEETE